MPSVIKAAVKAIPPIRRLVTDRDNAHKEIASLTSAYDSSIRKVESLSRDHADSQKTVLALSSERDEIKRSLQALLDEREELITRIETLERNSSHIPASLLETPHHPFVERIPSATKSVEITDDYRKYFRKVLFQTSYAESPSYDRDSDVYAADIHAHVERRFNVFDRHIVPWIQQAAPRMSEMTAIEIGSGTGSSTLAFAPHVKKMFCFEIDAVSSGSARARLDYFGLSNVEIRNELFGPDSDVVKRRETVHLIVLCAVLEHMHFHELQTALKTAWDVLSPGGLLVVADTPNRFAAFDEHTSLLPFFSALPKEIQKRYAAYSPRKDFVESMKILSGVDADEALTRWGSGISYHDVELALGHSCHDHVVLDGYEPIILSEYPDHIDDILLRVAFHHHKVPAHRAFTRHNLHFALRK